MNKISSDILSVDVRDYEVQVYSEYTNWTSTVMYVDHFGNQCAYTASTRRNIPAVFQDVTKAEEYLNELRDRNPDRTYRLVRATIIREVIHD